MPSGDRAGQSTPVLPSEPMPDVDELPTSDGVVSAVAVVGVAVAGADDVALLAGAFSCISWSVLSLAVARKYETRRIGRSSSAAAAAAMAAAALVLIGPLPAVDGLDEDGVSRVLLFVGL